MAEVLRVEVHLVDASPVRPGDEWEPLEGDRANGVGGGAFSRGTRASLEDGPAVARAPGRLPTGARVGGGFRPGRVVTRSPDGRTRLEWACRGPVLQHLRRIHEWAVREIEVRPSEDEEDERAGRRAVALVTLCTPSALWRRGKFEPKDARGRVAVADVFGHAAGFEVPPSAATRARRDDDRAGFCGVLGCATHDARRGKRGGLAASLANLKPPALEPRPIQPANPNLPCAADAGEDAVAVIAGFLDAKAAACLAATCGGMRDRMDSHASGLSEAITLHPHQRAGLAWMRRRERPGSETCAAPDPRWRGPLFELEETPADPLAEEEEKSNGRRGEEDAEVEKEKETTKKRRAHPFWVDVVSGTLSSAAPPRFADAPGGLLCDEPGLGKTVTALALVLARRGARAAPPPGFRARRCAETGGWYYAGAPRLAGAAHGDDAGSSRAAVARESAATPIRGDEPPASAAGPSASARRSKRSRSSTPTGHFAAMERAAFEFSNPNSKAKRRRVSAAAATAEGLGAPKVLFPAAPSRLGPGSGETAVSPAGVPASPLSEANDATETNDATEANDANAIANDDATHPPSGFVFLNGASARLLSEGVTSRRNVAFFRRAMDAARRAVGLDPVDDVVEFILMNRGGNALITSSDPLLLPKWRFGDDPRPARALFELGLRPAPPELARATPKDWAWVPPATPPSEPARDRESQKLAFDVESLDEARSLAREGADGNHLDARAYLSSATLVVLPPVLISHWLEQIHFVTGGARDGPSVCVVGGGTDADPLQPVFGDGAPETTRWLFGVAPVSAAAAGTSAPTPDAEDADVSAPSSALFRRRRRAKSAHAALPSFEGLTPAALASRWDIVLMPANRLSVEFSRLDSPLLRVHWARVVLDEGHQMGGAAAITAKLSMACALKAHARWVMTGTPTPATLKGAGVGHLQPLLAFLGNAPFGVSQTAWSTAIQKPLERGGGGGSRRGGSVAGATRAPSGKGGKGGFLKKGKGKEGLVRLDGPTRDDAPTDANPHFDGAALAARLGETAAEDASARAEAAARLGSLLRRVAIRTLKSDIRLPPLRRSVTMLPFTKRHALAYNELVAFLRRGLLLADWADSNHVESLLNNRQARLASEAVTNLREAACVTGEFPVTCFAAEIDETVDDLTAALLRRDSSLSRERARQKAEALRYPLANHRGACQRCGAESFMPMLTPCAHLLCSACVAFVPDERPGEGSSSASSARLGVVAVEKKTVEKTVEKTDFTDFLRETRAPRRCPVCASAYVMQGVAPREDNPAPRRPVPQDLIEIQPSYVQHAWRMTDALEAQGESTKVEHLLSRLRAIGAAPSLEDRAKERAEELGLEAGARGAAAAAAAALDFEGDSHRKINAPPNRTWRWVRPRHKPAPPKCIVYSGFRTHLSVIDLGLTGAGVNFENIARMGMTRAQKDAALASFRADDQVAVLLLDRAAAEGLDLSFASRVFVMEPLDNASLEQQVVSRAHRMGQRETVRVEVLAMAGTAEETLLDVQAELAAAAAAEAAEAARRARRDEGERENDDDDDFDSDSDSEVLRNFEAPDELAEGRIAAAALSHADGASGGGARGGEHRGGVAPAAAADALSRRRVLQSLRLVPLPAAGAGEDRREVDGEGDGEGDDVAAERAAAANAAANVEANRLAAIAAETTTETFHTRSGDPAASRAEDPAPDAAPRRRGVTFAENDRDVRTFAEASPSAAAAPPAPVPPARGEAAKRCWTVRVRARAVGADGAPLAPALAPAPVRLPLGGATTAAKLRDAATGALAGAFREAGFVVDRASGSAALFFAPESGGRAIPLDGGALSTLGVEDRASLDLTLRATRADPPEIRDGAAGDAASRRAPLRAESDGRRLGGSPAAAGVGGVAGGLRYVASGSGPTSGTSSQNVEGRSERVPSPAGTFRGKKRRLGSSADILAAGGSRGAADPASVGGTVLDSDALDRRVARRVAAVAAADDISSAAMLRDPDAAEGSDGAEAFAGVPSASAMAADLLRAAEASSGSGSRSGLAADATVRSLQTAFRAVVAERAAEAEGNAKVSSALAGDARFRALPDGRLVATYRDASDPSKEKSDVVADLPPSTLPLILRVVAADARTSASARANLAPAAMAVASPRVFWAVVRYGGVGAPGGGGFAEALARLAPGAADWAALARRTRAKPERYSEYVSH